MLKQGSFQRSSTLTDHSIERKQKVEWMATFMLSVVITWWQNNAIRERAIILDQLARPSSSYCRSKFYHYWILFFFFFFWASYERFLVPLTHSSSALGKRKHIIKRQFRVVLASSKTKLSSPLSLSSCAHVHAHSWQFCRDLSSGS